MDFHKQLLNGLGKLCRGLLSHWQGENLSCTAINAFFFVHRTLEWFGLEGMVKLSSFQPQALGRDTFYETGCSKRPD